MSAGLMGNRISRIFECEEESTRGRARFHGRVLVVDDSSHGRWMISDILGGMGLEVEAVDSGRAAVEAVAAARKAKKPFDLVLMDSHMPAMDGYQATAVLRTRRYSGRIVVMRSESILELTGERTAEAGCDAAVNKPVTFQMLRDVVRKYLPNQRPVHQLRR